MSEGHGGGQIGEVTPDALPLHPNLHHQVPLPSGGTSSPGRGRGEVRLELAFEYLMSKDRLQWVTITSPQV